MEKEPVGLTEKASRAAEKMLDLILTSDPAKGLPASQVFRNIADGLPSLEKYERAQRATQIRGRMRTTATAARRAPVGAESGPDDGESPEQRQQEDPRTPPPSE